MQKKRTVNIRETEKNPKSLIGKTSSDFDPDYSHVVRNLKRIGILAVIFIAMLVILSFIL